jgi:hypothetical protein
VVNPVPRVSVRGANLSGFAGTTIRLRIEAADAATIARRA